MEFFLWFILAVLANDSTNRMEVFDPVSAWMFRVVVLLLTVATVVERINKRGNR